MTQISRSPRSLSLFSGHKRKGAPGGKVAPGDQSILLGKGCVLGSGLRQRESPQGQHLDNSVGWAVVPRSSLKILRNGLRRCNTHTRDVLMEKKRTASTG